VFNRRGHRRALSVPRWNLFGSTSDVREVVQHIAQIRPNAPLLNVGLSIGSGLLVRYFGEADNLFTAGAAVCPGYDISVCMSRVQQPYQSVLLASVKSFFLNRNSGLLSAIPGFEDCLRARTVQELLDKAYTMAGFATSDEYYEHCNPMVVARDITKPVLVINARDGNAYTHITLTRLSSC
jgi:predicted alpha/beta-fold hydrolase